MNKKISKSLFQVLLYLKLTCIKVKGGNSEFGIIGTQHHFINNLENGKIFAKYEKELNQNEYLINEIFTNLYSDIKNVYYKRTKEDNYIFNANSKSEKELIAITNFEGRIHKNNSPRKKYLSGVLGGIPMPADIDFEELIRNFNIED